MKQMRVNKQTYERRIRILRENSSKSPLIKMYEEEQVKHANFEPDENWTRDNLEYDLRTSDVIAAKCANRNYARRLYSALCNNRFQRNDVWPILQDKYWTCSWRYAGGIISDILQEGDYLDWYCGGDEGLVSDEVRQDLFALGWTIHPYEEEE